MNKHISIKIYLDRQGIKYTKAHGELITRCVFCDKDKHLYFNSNTGQYKCHRCGEEGNMVTLAKHLGDDLKNIFENTFSYQKKKEVTKVQAPVEIEVSLLQTYNKQLPDRIKEWLNNRGIEDFTIQNNLIGFAELYGRKWITIPVFDKNGKCYLLKLRSDPDDKENKNKGMVYPKGAKANLYGWKTIKNESKDMVVICEGEFDKLILEQQGVPTVTSANGAGTFKDEWIEEIITFKKIYICFDLDEAGKKGMEKLIGKIEKYIFDNKLHSEEINLYKINLPEELSKGGDVTDYFVKHKGNIDQFFDLAEKVEIDIEKFKSSESAVVADNTDEKNKKEKTAEAIVNYLMNEFDLELFLDQHNEVFVAENKNGAKIHKTETKEFERWILAKIYNSDLGYGKDSIALAKSILIGKALSSSRKYNLSVRVASKSEDVIWYDLGGKAIRIDERGYEEYSKPPIQFKHFNSQKKQITPEAGDVLDDFFLSLNIKSENDRILLKIFLVTCFIPKFPHPVLVVYGQQGAAKSTLFRMIKDIVDPSSIKTLPPIKNIEQLIQIVSHHWIALFDNLSSISPDLSDALCRASTGEGFSKRKLYSDDDDVIYNFQHIIGLNGINNVVGKPDLLDRSILIELSRIDDKDRKSEKEVNESFNLLKPKILGSCFNLVSKAIGIKKNLRLENKFRMADFTEWGYAIAEACGMGGKKFLEAYKENIQKQNMEAIEASSIGIAVLQLINNEPSGTIEATPTYLLSKLNKIAEDLGLDYKRDYTWPKNENWLYKKLMAISVNLEHEGVFIHKSRNEKRMISIIRKNIATDTYDGNDSIF